MRPPGSRAAAAQHLTIRENQITSAPETVALEDAAALPLVGLTALAALREVLTVGRDDHVLILDAATVDLLAYRRLLNRQGRSVSMPSEKRGICRKAMPRRFGGAAIRFSLRSLTSTDGIQATVVVRIDTVLI